MTKSKQKKQLRVVDGEQRGLKAPFGATKEQAAQNQRTRDIGNAIYEFRGVMARAGKAEPRGTRVLVIELTETESDCVDELIELHLPALGESRESVMKYLLTHFMLEHWL